MKNLICFDRSREICQHKKKKTMIIFKKIQKKSNKNFQCFVFKLSRTSSQKHPKFKQLVIKN